MNDLCKELVLSGKLIKERWSHEDYKYCTSDSESDSIEVDVVSIIDDDWYTVEFLWRKQININKVVFVTDIVKYKELQ
jgi:hypothetical protein